VGKSLGRRVIQANRLKHHRQGVDPGNQQRQQALFESRFESLVTAEQPDMDEANPVYSDYFTVAP
jgi:hypothetical protein